jgi:hypothetical protein
VRDMDTVDIWLDPICPWAWLASRWIAEVERLGEVKVDFRVMSLAYLNRDREMPPEYATFLTKGWKPVRTLTAARMQFGPEIVRPLYEAMGTRIHVESRGLEVIDEVIAESLAATNLPADLANAGEEVDVELIREHHAGMDQVGTDVGTPVISSGGAAFFGPVITPAPMGEAALQLWRGVMMVARIPGFYEIKRSRDKGPDFS